MGQYVEHITKGDLIFSNDLYSADEEYKNTPLINWIQETYVSGNFAYEGEKSTQILATNGQAAYDYRVGISIEHIVSTARLRIWSKPDISSFASIYSSYGQSRTSWTDISYSYGGTGSQLPNYSNPWTYAYNINIHLWQLETNIPVFKTNAELITYITTGTNIENAVNYRQPGLPAFFRCKFKNKGKPIISYKLTIGGSMSYGLLEKYEDGKLKDTIDLPFTNLNYYIGKLWLRCPNNGMWWVFATENSIEYNGTIYTASTINPFLRQNNSDARTTYTLTEVN